MTRICRLLLFAFLALSPRSVIAAITVNTTSDMKAPNRECTLREAVQTAFDYSTGSLSFFYPECKTPTEQDVIEFTPGLGIIELLPANGVIDLSTDLTIRGPAEISGQGQSQIFRIGGAFAINLYDLTLTKGSSSGGGGALLVNGGAAIVEIDGCIFANNVANGTFGGAIAFNGWELTVRHSNFRENNAAAHGGAIGGGGNWTIEDSLFSGNTAFTGGGALDCDGGGEFFLRRSALTGNTAFGQPNPGNLDFTNGGGAVMSGCQTSINQSLFENNFAMGKLGGGALYLTSAGWGAVLESVFIGNKAGHGPQEVGSGGAIHAKGDLLVYRSAFEQNTAKGASGGGGLFFENSTSEVVNSVIRSNNSLYTESYTPKPPGPPDRAIGGAISVREDSYVKIINSTLTDNVGLNELYFLGNGSVVLKNTAIGAWQGQETCGGDTFLIFDGENGVSGRNAQSKEGATCMGIPTDLLQSNILLWTFPAIIPGPTLLTFSYLTPKFNPGTGTGDSKTCMDNPVLGIDILGKSRPENCTIGAVEIPH